MFWPKSVWGKHASALDDLKRADKAGDAVACLNELVCSGENQLPPSCRHMHPLLCPWLLLLPLLLPFNMAEPKHTLCTFDLFRSAMRCATRSRSSPCPGEPRPWSSR